jgi:alpha-1,6-mannosyltransferase
MRSGLPTPMPWRAATLFLAAMAIGLFALTIATDYLHWRLGGWVLIASFAVAAICAFTAGGIAKRADQNLALPIILVGAAAMRLALVFSEPTLSSDIYRYIWDGRVQAAGINPYAHVPAASALAPLRDPDIWPHINRADYAVTIYPPMAQLVFFVMSRFGESVVTMKFGLLLFEAVSVAAMVALLRRLDIPVTHVAAYAWHPLPLWEVAGNGHVDAAMLAFILMGLLVYLHGRTLTAGVLITIGALIKPLALLALPVLWRPWTWRLPVCVAATIVLAYLPYLSVGSGVFSFVPGYVQEEGLASGSGFKLLWLVQLATGPLRFGTVTYLAASALALSALALAVGFRSDRSARASMRATSWMLIAFLVLISPNYPWYFLVLVPFLALSPSVTAWVLTSASVMFYDVIPNDVLPAYEVRIAVFTLAVMCALGHDLWKEWRKDIPVAVGGTT